MRFGVEQKFVSGVSWQRGREEKRGQEIPFRLSHGPAVRTLRLRLICKEDHLFEQDIVDCVEGDAWRLEAG